jgi:hypothetical protein
VPYRFGCGAASKRRSSAELFERCAGGRARYVVRTFRPLASWLVVAALLVGGAGHAAGRAPAQAAPAKAARVESPDSAAIEGSSALLELRVEATGLALDERSVREAILRELQLPDRPPVAGAAQVAIGLRVVSGGELTVTIHGDEGRDISRSVAAPDRADEVPEVTALLVGNLARDEAADLLSLLRQPEPEPVRGAQPSAAAAEPEPQLPLDSVNLSLVYPLTLRERTAERRFALELGLFYSRIGALSGVGLELGGVAHVLGRVDGLLLGGIGYWHGGPAEGVRIGGVLGVGGNGLEGVSLAGVTTIERGDVSGMQGSGVMNVAEGDVAGAQVTGVVNLAHAVQGAQLSGVFNQTRELQGVQLSAGLNLAERINGMQISVVNIGGDVDGAQIGIVNVARDVNGVQLGIVNVAREVDGVSLAYVPYSERGRTQAVVWFASSMPINLGVRFETGSIYVMPTFGYDPRGDAAIIDPIDGDYAPGVSLGYRLHIDRGFADLDVNYSNRSTGANYEENDIDLRYRLLGGFQVTRAFGLFAGGGIRHHFRTQGPADQFVKPELSVGIQLL